MNFCCQQKLEPTFQMLALVLAAALLFSSAISQETKTTCYCIKPDNDTSNSECFPLSHYVGDRTVIHNDSCLCFRPGEHYLDRMWKILTNSTLYNISLVASGNNVSEHKAVASIRCIGNHSAGIVVKNVSGLKIAGLSFTNCGHIFKIVENIASSLLLVFVEDLSMSGVEIHDSNGWGMYCFSLLGNSTITYTLISGGHYITNHSGGNLRFKYVGDCVYNHVSSITISDSIIENGAENCTDSNAYAGGIDIYFITRNRINMYFNNVTFHNNSGYDGGNVAVSYSTRGDGWNSTLTFTKCTISAGYAAHDGGGLYMEVIKVSSLPALLAEVPNSVILSVVETNFTGNYANSEGAGLFLQIHEDQDLTITAELHFFSCKFANNIAKSSQSGTAVHIVNINLPESVPHRVPQYYISFDECSFEDNGEQNWNIDNNLLGCGTMYVAENAITVIKNSRFLNNICSGIVAVQSSIIMNGSILIADNVGYNGAGIMLCANSKLFLTKEANVTIQENQALNFGGGIYAEFQCSQAVPPCFYGTEENDTLVYLVNNNASRAGDALYGGSVDSCYTSPNSFLVDGKRRVSFDTLFEITQFNPTKSKITSDPYKVCLCNNSYYNQSNCVTTHNYSDSALYPGMVIHVYVVLAGQRNGAVPGVVKASFENNENINSAQETQLVKSTENCTKLEYDIIPQYQSDRHHNDKLYLSVENAYYRTRNPSQHFHSTVNLSISRCPLGFSLSNNRCTCSNVLRKNLKSIVCNIEDQTATRDVNVDWWLGFEDGMVIYSTFCPFDFCQNLRKVSISFKNSSDHNEQCAFDRSGKLCGACPTNHSNIFGSSWCRDCRFVSPIKTFAVTVLIGFVGILLLVCLGVLNLNVTEGPLNPIIFYMNVVRLNDSVFFGYGGNRVHYLLRVFVAWVNLDLGKDTCYYNGMGAIGKSSLQFVFPFYMWFLCGLFIYLSRHSSLLSRITGKRSVKLLATVILLSYTKILKTVIDIVWPSSLSEIKDNHVVHHQTVWQMDGTFHYFHHHHRILFIFAAIVAVGTLPYTLSLLFIQYLNKMSHYKVLFWVVKLKPFFDAYTGPYKDNYHFWTGFLLVVRFFLFITIACNTAKGPMLNLTLVCSTAAVLFILSQCGVYKVRILCFLESFVYFNLILFSIGTAYVIQENSVSKAFYYSNNKAVLVCVGSMFLLFCGIVAYNIKTILIQTQCWGNLKVWLLERQWVRRKKTPIKSLVLQRSVSDSSSSSGEDEMDPILENAPPVARYDQFREPLIETH